MPGPLVVVLCQRRGELNAHDRSTMTILTSLIGNVRMALLLGALAPAWAATAATLDRSDAAGDTIALSGEISSGDADRLAVLVEGMSDHGTPALAVRLDSLGD